MACRRISAALNLAVALLGLACGGLVLGACSAKPSATPAQSSGSVAAAPARTDFPRPDKFGGFDARKAYAHLETTVGHGPRPPASDNLRKSQEYIKAQLASFGCAVEEDNFEASTPVGRLKMKNIVGKKPGENPSVILLLSHYDTKQMPEVPNFVGANDPGSSLAIVLELARIICPRSNKATYWFGFVDGEEAFGEWSDTNSTFGSRQMAAKLALSGELKQLKAVVLLDLVGGMDLRLKREANSTGWLKDIIWGKAKDLGYAQHFLNEETAGVSDDHIPFVRRKVPAVDIIGFEYYPQWHTAADTPDKISPRSLAIVGHVVLESLPLIEKHIL